MSQLEPEKYAEIAMKIDELAPLARQGTLPGAGNGFINDQFMRKAEYGERMFLSSKQVAWIEQLHDEHVGSSDGPCTKGIDGRDDDD